jgi:hypothetical protein
MTSRNRGRPRAYSRGLSNEARCHLGHFWAANGQQGRRRPNARGRQAVASVGKVGHVQGLSTSAPARSRTWIYRLGGWLDSRPKRPDLSAAAGDLEHSTRSAMRLDKARFGWLWAAEAAYCPNDPSSGLYLDQ